MKIEIAIEQQVKNKEKIVLVKSIIMHPRNKLPSKYTQGDESVCKHNGCVALFQHDHTLTDYFLCENVYYREDVFEEKLKLIKRCAKRLHDINQELTKLLTDSTFYSGEQTITV
ncbi:hypothetical protein KA005_49530 [bacterium]|nr:hypothetical protein [bacterium]